MEDPIPLINDDVELLPIPPMDLDFLAGDLSFPEDFAVEGVDFDFTFDDLDFADDLLLEPEFDVSHDRNHNSELNRSSSDVRVCDCSNQVPIFSQESNFGETLKFSSPNSDSCKSNSGVSHDTGNNSDQHVSHDQNPNSEQNWSSSDVRVYDCSNQVPIFSQESNFSETLKFSSPNSNSCKSNSGVSHDSGNNSDQHVSHDQNPNSEQNRSSSDVRFYDCLNQVPVSSEESNFGEKLNCSSLNSGVLHDSGNNSGRDGNSNSEQNRSSGDVRVYDCSNEVPISSEESNFGEKLNCSSPNSGVWHDSGNNSDRDVSSSSFVNNDCNDNHVNSESKLSETGSLKGKIKVEEMVGSKNNLLSKRKKEREQEQGENSDECKTSKFKRSSLSAVESVSFNVGSEKDEKRKARLMRNRESAQLSRQRKKRYVEELQDKVRSMHSTITELNSRISYVMAENATLRQQLVGGAGAGAGAGACPPPSLPGMYPMGMAPMPYPWMPCPPYMVKPQGSQVPLVPIPRLKPQQPAPSSKVNKKVESKKKEGKTKKVASISFLGLLFFFLLFGGLLPMVNVRYGGVRDGFSGLQKGTVLRVDNHMDRMGIVGEKFNHGRVLQQSNISDGFGPIRNSTEPLVASLYVPRNDKLVKIDGNLIIHSVLASERAVASHTEPRVKTSEETGLAIVRRYPPYPVPRPGKNDGRHPHLNGNPNGRQRAIGSGFSDESKPAASDGKLQQWFREGLAGPMLSSGMCTEVFQFDVSPTRGSIVPATFISNTSENCQNSTQLSKPRNRRILKGHPIPLNGNRLNFTEEHVSPPKPNDGLNNNKSQSSIVVSVLVDPREAGDGDGEGVIRSKSLSRIFVVVLIDSVKYVTYSCMLPFVGSGNHLVTT